MVRILRLLLKWSRYLLKGLLLIPRYLHHWGILYGSRRLVYCGAFHGLTGLMSETYDIQRLKRRQTLELPDHLDYLVYAPDFVSSSAGIRCLHRLADDLQAAGFSVALVGCQRGRPGSTVPIATLALGRRATLNGSWIIYPETVPGNPFRAEKVIRWVLNRPGLLGGEKVYDPRELVFLYSEVYRPYVNNQVAGKLYIPTLDRTLFYPPLENMDRPLELYYVGKSKYVDGHVDPERAFEITRESPARKELGKLFRSARMLHCFDNSTALIYEALLCGCPVTIIPDGTQTWADYEQLELGVEGIGWGQAPAVSADGFFPHDLTSRLERAEREYAEQLRALIARSAGQPEPAGLEAARTFETSVL